MIRSFWNLHTILIILILIFTLQFSFCQQQQQKKVESFDELFENLSIFSNNLTVERTVHRLGKWPIYTDLITIAGHSSGAGISHLLHLAHSNLFLGVGIFAGLYYQYNGVPKKPFILGKDQPDPPGVGVENSIHYLHKYNKKGLVARLSNLKHKRIFIYAGTKDEFHSIFQRAYPIKRIYEPLVQNPSKQINVVIKYATHAKPTGTCTAEAIKNGYECYYNGVKDFFKFMFQGQLNVDNLSPVGDHKKKFYKFDQTEFFNGLDLESISMHEFGYLYIPSSCSTRLMKSRQGNSGGGNDRRCLLHIFFRGCGHVGDMGSDLKKDDFTEWLKIAEANSMILLFPLQKVSAKNPSRCWDYLGYTGSKYATRKGVQIQVLRRIISRITGL